MLERFWLRAESALVTKCVWKIVKVVMTFLRAEDCSHTEIMLILSYLGFKLLPSINEVVLTDDVDP